MTVSVTNCQFCGQSHGLRCPEVKAVEYNPDGTIKRVEYLTPADRYFPAPQQNVGPAWPTYPYVIGDPWITGGQATTRGESQ